LGDGVTHQYALLIVFLKTEFDFDANVLRRGFYLPEMIEGALRGAESICFAARRIRKNDLHPLRGLLRTNCICLFRGGAGKCATLIG
jgi:hypothetical protein